MAKQKSCKFEKEIKKKIALNYLLYLPKTYDLDEKEWPLILFLHGRGERGNNLQKVKLLGIPKIIEENDDFPFIVVSPQCPNDSYWTLKTEELMKLLEQITANYRVDTDRIYLTGLSMGGFGAWSLASEYPDAFAAVVPICGGGDRGAQVRAHLMKHTPVWAFHGAKDEVTSPDESRKMVEILEQCGGNVKFTLYPEADHDSWTKTYNDPELYEWLLEQRE